MTTTHHTVSIEPGSPEAHVLAYAFAALEERLSEDGLVSFFDTPEEALTFISTAGTVIDSLGLTPWNAGPNVVGNSFIFLRSNVADDWS